jgi:putative ABC transport system permease protein
LIFLEWRNEMGAFSKDLRHGARMLLKNPSFTLIAVVTLGLGIGANTAIFSVVNSVLLRPLPFREAARLVVPVSVNSTRGADSSSITYADYLDWRRERIFAHVAAIDNVTTSADLSGGAGEPERIGLAIVSEDYFAVLGAAALLGRTFQADDFSTPGPARALVISYALWQRRYGGDAHIIGQNIYLNGRPYPVVGVMPPNSLWPLDRDVWVPLAVGTNPGPDLLRRDNMIFTGLARLKPAATLEQANAAMATIARRLEQDHPESRQGWSNRAVPLLEYVVGKQLRTSLLVLLTGVGFVLLIACVNVANLLLARAATRDREMAIRLALGAGRGRLIRQLLTESLLLASVGGVLGFLLAIWGVDLLTMIAPADMPRLAEIGVSRDVLGFTLSISLLTAIVSGSVPALQSSRTDINHTLKDAGRQTAGGVRGGRLRNALVVIEVALSLVLLVGAGLMIRSFSRVQRIDPGIDAEHLVTMEVTAPRVRYPDETRILSFYRDLVERVDATPGVDSAAITSALPVGGGGFYLGRVFLVEGRPEPPAGTDVGGQWNVVSPNYFKTSGIRLVKGRDFDERDTAASNPVIIINETMARRLFSGDDPLGKRVRSWRDENQLREIVGVVADVRYYGRDDELRGLVYVPHAQNTWRSMALNVRTHGNPAALITSIRGQIKAVDKDLAVANLRTMTSVLHQSVASRRLSMLLLLLFAIAAAALAAVGIYGVLAYAVAQRRHEIGIRMTLGAPAAEVFRMVLGQGIMLALIGIAIGLAAAYGLTRLMASLLYGVTATDPLTFVLIPAMIIVVSLLASYLPARRAMKVDPMIALRYE